MIALATCKKPKATGLFLTFDATVDFLSRFAATAKII